MERAGTPRNVGRLPLCPLLLLTFFALVCRRWRVIDRHLVAWIRDVNRGLDYVRVPVRAFRERMRSVDLDMHNIIAFRYSGDVDPLAAELFEIPIRPARRNALVGAGVTAALVVVRVLEQVFQTERLLMSLRSDRAVQVEQLIIGKTREVIMTVAR
jgi:hypothetical protein